MFASGPNPYATNARRLYQFAPFHTLALSAAYLTPFFLEKGMNLAEIFLLQSIFSVALLFWEIPSGVLADKWGRARCIKWSAPVAAIALVAYGLSDSYPMFAACEILLAIATGLLSGADDALLYDSLRADQSLSPAALKTQYEAWRRRIKFASFMAVGAAAPVAYLLARYIGVSATIVADGLLAATGSYFAWKLVEAPYRESVDSRQVIADETFREELVRLFKEAWDHTGNLLGNINARWLLALGSVLSTATYVAAWVTVPYYQSIGVPLALFGVLFATRSWFKALLNYRYSDVLLSDSERFKGFKSLLRYKLLRSKPSVQRTMSAYAGLSGAVYLTMASSQPWLLWAVAGHDVVHGLHEEPILSRLNAVMDPDHRAMLNSVVRMVYRAAFAVAGLLAGVLMDAVGLQTGLLIIGLTFTALAIAVLLRLQRLGTFQERR